MPEPEVVRVSRRFADALLRGEEKQVKAMVERYLLLQRRLEGQIDALSMELSAMRARGEALPFARVERLERYRKLQAQAAGEIAQYNRYAASTIEQAQRSYGEAGITAAAEKLKATEAVSRLAEVRFDQLARNAVVGAVGLSGDGAPLTRLLDEVYGDVAGAIRDELTDAVAQGINPRQTARKLRDALGVGLNDILTIARTEQLRAFRLGEQTAWQSSDIVERYQRLAHKSARTCVACLAMDGAIFPMSEPFTDHPRGRCSMMPLPYGFDGYRYETGAAWFASQDASTQIRIAGPTRTQLLREGKVTMHDLASFRDNERWGGSWVPTSVRELQRVADLPKSLPATAA